MYALVAQPVEHLTFNQRARDSSSLERTKIPRRIVRFLVGFSFYTPFAQSLHGFCTVRIFRVRWSKSVNYSAIRAIFCNSGQQSQAELRFYGRVCVLQKLQQCRHGDGRFCFNRGSLHECCSRFVEAFLKPFIRGSSSGWSATMPMRSLSLTISNSRTSRRLLRYRCQFVHMVELSTALRRQVVADEDQCQVGIGKQALFHKVGVFLIQRTGALVHQQDGSIVN